MPLLYILGASFLLFCLYLLSLRPGKYRPISEKFVRERYAHRGLWGESAAENSLTAFRRAVEQGYAVEMDVHLSKDGALVVFHDEHLERMTGCRGSVRDYTAEELSHIKLGKTNDSIPTFREVLDVISGKVPILLEIKPDRNWRDISAAAISMLKDYKGPVCMESFHPFAVRYFAKNAPHIPRGFLWGRHFHYKSFRRPEHFLLWTMCFNWLAKPDFIAANWEFANDFPLVFVRTLYKSRYLLWTVRSAEVENAVKPLTHGFIFEGYLPDK